MRKKIYKTLNHFLLNDEFLLTHDEGSDVENTWTVRQREIDEIKAKIKEALALLDYVKFGEQCTGSDSLYDSIKILRELVKE